MRKLLMLVFLIALPVNFTPAGEENVLIQEEEKEPVYSDGIKVDLTDEEVKEAIDWGAENKDSPEVIRRPYEFGGSDVFEERGYVCTKFLSLAICACTAAKKYQSPSNYLLQPLRRSNYLSIFVNTYGIGKDFANYYHMVLKQGEKIIQPTLVEAPFQIIATGCWSPSPSYMATVLGLFPYSEINPKGKATIILIKDRGESKFEVDFSHYK